MLHCTDKLKYSHEFDIYLQDSIDYMRDILEKKVVIIIDDLDHLESDVVAKDVCALADKIATSLGDTPVLVSIREETLAKTIVEHASAPCDRVVSTSQPEEKTQQEERQGESRWLKPWLNGLRQQSIHHQQI